MKKIYISVVVVLFLSCLVAGAGWLNAKWGLETARIISEELKEQIVTQNLQYSQALQETNYQIEVANQQILFTNNRAEFANAAIQELKQELAGAEKWRDYWWQRAHPKQFESLDALKAWLALDNTDSVLYIFGSGRLISYDCDDYAVALVYNALQAGYSVSTQIVGGHMLNSTIIGNEVYFIEPQTDEVKFWGYRDKIY